MIVLDASFALNLHLNNEKGVDAARFLANTAATSSIAPDLVLAEVANATWKTARAGQISSRAGLTILASVTSMFSRLVPSVALAPRALEIATEIDHPVYDAMYLALAEREATQVVTFDQRLEVAVQGSRWRSLVHCLG